ncbi:MAG: hypothetical protein J6S49_02510 [Erysipelotrichaceae bacterium]|nr:hypothetical protein [Erysipelotrichaceae bacterium]MBP5280759.1 hypothetical protein [Erysipelotrichaceae bacterium]
MSDLEKRLSEISQEQLDKIAGGLAREQIMSDLRRNFPEVNNAYLTRYLELLESGKSLADTMLILGDEFPDPRNQTN